METQNPINAIKTEVEENIGRRVVLKADRGRKRIVTRKGVIEDAFQEVFTVRTINEYDIERTVSYSYSDILTSTVKLTLF